MPLETLNQEEWVRWRPTLIDLYKRQTADYIAVQLRNEHSINVTAKMLRDRFKTWNAETKYKRRQPLQQHRQRQKARTDAAIRNVGFAMPSSMIGHLQQPCDIRSYQDDVLVVRSIAGPAVAGPIVQRENLVDRNWTYGAQPVHDSMLLNVTNPFVSPEPTRNLNSPNDDRHLRMTLKEVAGYLDCICEQRTWIYRREEPAFELQKLAAKAHMAISSQSYDSHQIWHELDSLYSPVCEVIPTFDEDNLLTMHPRTLVVLLRLLVDSLSSEIWASETLRRVKRMFGMVTSQTLRATHPVRLLCGMPKHSSNDVLFRLLELMDVRLFARVSDEQPDGPTFVAQEQTYAARVLASLGYTQWAEVKLQSVISSLDSHTDPFTSADAFRTFGYNCEQASAKSLEDPIVKLQEAKGASSYALQLFMDMGKGYTNEAMYTHVSLSQICRRLGDLPSTEMHLTEAIEIWQRLSQADDQAAKLILDLNQVLIDQGKFQEMRELRRKYEKYFEESKGSHEDQGD